MNRNECEVLRCLYEKQYVNQRALSEATGISLGSVNQSLKSLMQGGYVDRDICLTDKALKEFEDHAPRSAIILAAGAGLRMIPINNSLSKGLLEVRGERLIERTIKHLHEVGIYRIYIIVGFMNEQYEYLIDKYQVELIVNKEYALTNSIVSLGLALKYISNTYIVPCDIWCAENPFGKNELYSWYMVSDERSLKSYVRVNRKKQLDYTDQSTSGNRMIGISYLTGDDTEILKNRIKELLKSPANYGLFWEDALKMKDKFLVSAKLVDHKKFCEIDTYEQLRALDSNSNQLRSDTIELLANIFKVSPAAITNIAALKKGMTNRSFLFSVNGKRYIMRIPGEGTDMLINRKEEASVYRVIRDKNICDNIVYLNPDNGYKVTEFLEETRTCDAFHEGEVRKCMAFLRDVHERKLKVGHTFNIHKQIEFYQSLWGNRKSAYRDYEQTKQHVYELKEYIDQHKKEYCLTHIDAVPDNFLFVKRDKSEEIRLIDWEYAGMQDPDVDLAMFSIYSLYDKEQVDCLIESYYTEGCLKETRLKIYCYIATCGLLWSNWCEYKRIKGVEFGEYALRQYRYAKDYYKIFKEEAGIE